MADRIWASANGFSKSREIILSPPSTSTCSAAYPPMLSLPFLHSARRSLRTPTLMSLYCANAVQCSDNGVAADYGRCPEVGHLAPVGTMVFECNGTHCRPSLTRHPRSDRDELCELAFRQHPKYGCHSSDRLPGASNGGSWPNSILIHRSILSDVSISHCTTHSQNLGRGTGNSGVWEFSNGASEVHATRLIRKSQKTASRRRCFEIGGGCEIRTHGRLHVGSFQDCWFKPLTQTPLKLQSCGDDFR